MSEEFLLNTACPRCKGPVSSKPITATTFHEDDWDYARKTMWLCYSCGKNIPDDELVQMESNS